jgi:hypothetical protein
MNWKRKRIIVLILNYSTPLVFVSIGLLFFITSDENFAYREDHSLGWALSIANGVRDAKLPGAKLVEILGSVDAQGEITQSEYTNEWTFYYYLQNGENFESLGVTIYYDGSAFSWDPGGTICDVEVPSYKDAKSWVQKADNTISGITFTYRGIQVFADCDNIYANVENTVYIYYHTPDGELEAYVILDSDTERVLLVEKNP